MCRTQNAQKSIKVAKILENNMMERNLLAIDAKK